MPTMEGRRPVYSQWGKSSQSAAQTLSLTPMIRAAVPFALMRLVLLRHKGVFSTLRHIEPNAEVARKRWGQSPADLFAYSHMSDAFAENKS
jgi:hypothetical protein